jgi:ribosomal protein S18 acetylase RimI-like enzyme
MKLKKILSEMPKINLKGKTAFGNDKPLKRLKLKDVTDNIVIFREDSPMSLLPQGMTFVYFMDSEENAKKISNGKLPMLILPTGSRYGSRSPFQNALRKKKHEHIIGFIQGYTSKDEIYISFMKVRPQYRRNTINTKMVQALKKEFPGAKIKFEDPTKDGNKFIDKTYPDAEKV